MMHANTLRMLVKGAVTTLLISIAAVAGAQTVGISRSDDSMRIDLGYGIIINKDSTLRRQIITIHDTTKGAKIKGKAPVIVEYKSKKYGGDFIYKAHWTIVAESDIMAIETRFLMFDVWGDSQRTLSATYIVDIKAGNEHSFDGQWRVWNENQATNHNASIAYIAQVRTADGKIWKANEEQVLGEATRFTEAFKREQLKPTIRPNQKN